MDVLGEQPDTPGSGFQRVSGVRRKWGVGLETDVPLDEFAVLVAQQPWLEDAADRATASAVNGYAWTICITVSFSASPMLKISRKEYFDPRRCFDP